MAGDDQHEPTRKSVPDGGPETTRPADDVMSRPNPDPGEEYPHVNTQLFGVVDPAGNATSQVGDMQPPFNAPAAGTDPTMDGFVRDYVNNIA